MKEDISDKTRKDKAKKAVSKQNKKLHTKTSKEIKQSLQVQH